MDKLSDSEKIHRLRMEVLALKAYLEAMLKGKDISATYRLLARNLVKAADATLAETQTTPTDAA